MYLINLDILRITKILLPHSPPPQPHPTFPRSSLTQPYSLLSLFQVPYLGNSSCDATIQKDSSLQSGVSPAFTVRRGRLHAGVICRLVPRQMAMSALLACRSDSASSSAGNASSLFHSKEELHASNLTDKPLRYPISEAALNCKIRAKLHEKRWQECVLRLVDARTYCKLLRKLSSIKSAAIRSKCCKAVMHLC